MKRKNRILVRAVVIAVIVVGTGTLIGVFWGPQTPDVPTAEEVRLEILKKAVNLVDLDDSEMKENKDVVFYNYYVQEYNFGIREVVYIAIYAHSRVVQSYSIVGLGKEVFEVNWSYPIRSKRISVEKKDGKLKYESYPVSLPEEKAEEVFERGYGWYAETRRFFRVDTNDGLEKVIKEIKESQERKWRELELK